MTLWASEGPGVLPNRWAPREMVCISALHPGQRGRGAGHGRGCPQGATGLAHCQTSLCVLPNKSRATWATPQPLQSPPLSGPPDSPWPWQVCPADGCRAAARAGSLRSRPVCQGEQAGGFGCASEPCPLRTVPRDTSSNTTLI